MEDGEVELGVRNERRAGDEEPAGAGMTTGHRNVRKEEMTAATTANIVGSSCRFLDKSGRSAGAWWDAVMWIGDGDRRGEERAICSGRSR